LWGYQIPFSVLMIQLFTTVIEEQDKLNAIAIGHKSGLEWLYKTGFITTKKMVIKFGGNEDEAWDVFQEAVTFFYEKCSTEGIQLNCKITTYITSVARNIWLKKFNQKMQFDEGTDIGEVPDTKLDVQDFLKKDADLDVLMAALETLGEPCNKLLKAFYIDNKSMNDISEQLGFANSDHAKTQKYKCLTRLKKIFFNTINEDE
jgi:RNA polymerase sigma factor (sigma-70 family)